MAEFKGSRFAENSGLGCAGAMVLGVFGAGLAHGCVNVALLARPQATREQAEG